MDVRAYLHRDGSVIMHVSVEDLQNPQALYQAVSGYPVSCQSAELAQCCRIAALRPFVALIVIQPFRPAVSTAGHVFYVATIEWSRLL